VNPPLDTVDDPILEFDRWFREAAAAGARQPDAMALATATPEAMPDVRYVLLKGWGPKGFEFYTNYESAKGTELGANPRAALAIFWYETHRQVRAGGVVTRLSRRESERYWRTRPHESQAAAYVSEQSRPIASREDLEARFAAVLRDHPREVPLPDSWGGYRLRPEWIEFWQGRPNRLHDRLRYVRMRSGAWRSEPLAP
jgi:pyridoxamine 5'-phosphate oxidase